MHDQIRMGHLGLDDHETRVLKTIFSLSPQLKDGYVLIGSSGLEKADLVLVNLDVPEAIANWKKIARVNRLATPITLSAHGRSVGGVVSLTQPIRLQQLIDVLENVVADRTEVKNPDGSSKSESALNILIVDDSYPVRKYMEQKLTEIIRYPLRLSLTASGEDAMAKIAKRDFDLVFLDVIMEGVDGYKVCKEIKSKYNTYVVMLTSRKSPFDKVRGTMSGCDAYITKPPEDEKLVEEVEKCVTWREKKQNSLPRQARVVTA